MILSHMGCGLDIAQIASVEGHDVYMVVLSPRSLDIGRGLVDLYYSLEEGLDRDPDFIIVDDVYFSTLSEELRREGYVVFGSSLDTDVWENNREVGEEVMRSAGILVPETESFCSFDDAIRFVEDVGGMWVLKSSGRMGTSKSKTVVPVFDSEVLSYLKLFSKECKEEEVYIQLQKMVDGVEIAFGGFFNGEKFVGLVNVNFEHKRAFNGHVDRQDVGKNGLGPLTGEAGTLSLNIHDFSFFYEKATGRVESWLRRAGFRGYIDLNGILDEEGNYWGLEWTPRPGWPIWQILLRQIKSPVIERLFDVARGGDGGDDWVDEDKRWGIGVGYFVLGSACNIPIKVEEENWSWLGWDDVKREEGEYRSLSDEGSWYKRVFVVVGTGRSVDEAKELAYNKIRGVKSTYGWYRTDIGDRWYRERDIVCKYVRGVE